MTKAKQDGVYFVKVTMVRDSEDCGEAHFFNSLQEAQKKFNALVKEIETNIIEASWEIAKNKHSYYAHETGAYSENRVAITLERKLFED